MSQLTKEDALAGMNEMIRMGWRRSDAAKIIAETEITGIRFIFPIFLSE